MKTAKQIAKELREKGLKVRSNAVARLIIYLRCAVAPETLCLRPVTKTGRGRHSRYEDRRGETLNILSFLGVNYEIGNDAPKGGLTGTTVKVKTAELLAAIA